MSRKPAPDQSTMTTDEYNDALMAAMTEAEFQGWIVRLAQGYGWQRDLIYHTHDSSKSQGGFPDLVLVKPPRILLWELKSMRGRVSPAQEKWVAAFRECGMEAAILYPCDWRKVEEELSREPIPPAPRALANLLTAHLPEALAKRRGEDE